MKTRSLMKKGMKVTFLFALALAVTNCSKDDDTPPTYNFEEDFQNLEEMPDITIEEPSFEEPDLGGVEESPAAQSLIADLQDGGDLSAETQANLDEVDNFTAGFSANAAAEAAGLDAARIAEIMAMDSFDGDLAEVESALESMPAEIVALLPTINFSDDFNLSQDFSSKTGSEHEKTGLIAQANQGPCFEMANDAYENAMAAPTAKFEEQQGNIAAAQAIWEADAETRAQNRENNIAEGAQTYRETFTGNAEDILDLAIQFENNGDTDTATTLRMYALIYAVQSSKAITTWEEAANQVVQSRLQEELAKILEVIEMLENETEANFMAIQNAAQGILNNALDNCHDQG